MTMLAMLKPITWNGNACATVHLQLPLHLTDVPLLSVIRPGAAVGKEKKKLLKASKDYCHCNILSTTLKTNKTTPKDA